MQVDVPFQYLADNMIIIIRRDIVLYQVVWNME